MPLSSFSYSPRLPFWQGAAALTVAVILAVAIGLFVMYRAGFKEQRRSLADITESEASLIEAIAHSNRQVIETTPRGGESQWQRLTMKEVREALVRFDSARRRGGELVLGEPGPQGGIHIIHRRQGKGGPPSGDILITSKDHLAEPMRLALAGHSGTVVARDYRGDWVLAAYAPLPTLHAGLVAKRKLSDIRHPFVMTGLKAVGISLALVILALFGGRWALRPVLQRLSGLNEVIATLLRSAPGLLYRASGELARPLELLGDGARTLIGYEPQELTGGRRTALTELIHPADRATVESKMREALDANAPMEATYRLRTKDAKYRWVQDYAYPASWDGRRVFYGLLFDVSVTHDLAEQRQQLIDVLDASPDFVAIADPHLQTVYINNGGRRMLGLESGAPLPDLHLAEWLPQWSWHVLKNNALPAARENGSWQGTMALLGPEGGEIPVSAVVIVHHDADGNTRHYSCVARDLSEYNRLQDAVEKQRQEFRSVVTKATTGMVVIDERGDVVFSNPAAQDMLGRRENELKGAPLGIPITGVGISEVQILANEGRVRTAEIAVTETEWDGHSAYLVMLHDITDRREAEAALRHMAYHDILTGLPNRALLSERIASALSEAKVTGDSVAVLFIDLDRFKTINDSLGHGMGDRLLQAVGERIRSVVRNSDTVARVGGDEFAIVLEGIKDRELPMQIGDKLRAAMQEPLRMDEHELVVECSIGVSLYPADARNADLLIRHADTAMYAAKSQGRNLVMRFSAAQGASIAEEFQLRNRLRSALEKGEFVLYYQPQVELATERVIGHEALIRWQHPEMGLLSPGRFLPVLEDTGLIEGVGNWVLRTAFSQAVRWADHFPDWIMGVNLSGYQLRHSGIVTTVLAAIDEAGLDRRRVGLEITESMAITNLEHTHKVLSQFRREGLQILLDDFGTGYSSLKYLHRLQVDVVKIGMEFVQALPRPDAASLIRAIISMGHSLGLVVLAEGVETPEQADFLRREGCEYAQGYLFGRPEPDGAFDADGFANVGAAGREGPT